MCWMHSIQESNIYVFELLFPTSETGLFIGGLIPVRTLKSSLKLKRSKVQDQKIKVKITEVVSAQLQTPTQVEVKSSLKF